LVESRPDADAPVRARESWPDFIVDLATLERTFAEVFDGLGVEGETILNRDQLLRIPLETLLETPLIPVVCFRLLAFSYPVSEYFDAVRRKDNPDLPPPANTYLAMNRRDYVVRIHELNGSQYELLMSLSNGSTVGQLASGQTDRKGFVTTILAWLEDWADKGFFAAPGVVE